MLNQIIVPCIAAPCLVRSVTLEQGNASRREPGTNGLASHATTESRKFQRNELVLLDQQVRGGRMAAEAIPRFSRPGSPFGSTCAGNRQCRASWSSIHADATLF